MSCVPLFRPPFHQPSIRCVNKTNCTDVPLRWWDDLAESLTAIGTFQEDWPDRDPPVAVVNESHARELLPFPAAAKGPALSAVRRSEDGTIANRPAKLFISENNIRYVKIGPQQCFPLPRFAAVGSREQSRVRTGYPSGPRVQDSEPGQ